MGATGFIAIGIGAACGAWLRWLLGVLLNPLAPLIPAGTLIANLCGAYVIGLAIAYFAQAPGIAPEWRLLVVTGFCGALTTFSTFSAEITSLMQQGRFGVFAAAVALHVGGSVAMTVLGLASWKWLGGR